MQTIKRIVILTLSMVLAGLGLALTAPKSLAKEPDPKPYPEMCLVTPEWVEKINHEAVKVHETRWKKTVETEKTEYRFKKWTREKKSNSHTEYRYRTRVWIEKYLEVKEVNGYDFVDGGTTKVNGQTVAGHWVKKDGWHRIPDVIINIVWGPNGPPDSVLGEGNVNLRVYGGPSVSVRYKAYKKDYSGWSDWGPWSDWSKDSVSESDTRQVEKKTVEDEDRYTEWSFVKWTEWSSDDSKTDTETVKYTDREKQVVKGESYTVYYRPDGEPTKDLTEKNWTETAPGGNWVFVDERDRVVKEAWVEEIIHPAVYEPCKEEPRKKVTKKFQVDTYSNPTAKLAKKAQGYDNDGKLKWGEDKPHYGHSKWQIVKIKGYDNWTKKQWMSAINKATTKKGVGSVNSTSHIKTVKKKQKLTVAWEIKKYSWPDSKKRQPQVFFARGVK